MKAKHLVRLRRVSQGFFLVLFLFLLVRSRLPQDVYLNYSLLFTADQDLRLGQPVDFCRPAPDRFAIQAVGTGVALFLRCQRFSLLAK